ncbi:chemotaxis protein [Thermosipho affectus]|uniref:Chemotaxis protein n=1 Tax=Thermosipho affectus TaxID=660294 RepID=A0ABX3ILR5_9BACT|nr:heme NO-binding domain-containing protein [Thermosipho affectus]ONN27568.1 chemotaxis protein [Thermosipho affectus]
MKSFVMNIWINTWKRLYGESLVDSLINEFNVDLDILQSPINDVDDEMVIRFSRKLAEKTGKTFEKVWEETGYENIKSFHKYYPGYFKKDGILSFLSTMDMVHRALTRRIKGAKPPRIIYKYIDEKTAIVRYQSNRDFRSYFLGLVRGASDFFKDPITTEVLDQGTNNSTSFVEIRIKASKPYGKLIKLKSFRLVSFGILKNILKSNVIFLPLIVFIVSLLSSSFLSPVVSSIIVALSTFALSLPIVLDLKKGFSALKFEDLSSVTYVSGEENFEKITHELNKANEKIKELLISFQGDTEELLSFSSKTMSSIEVVEEQIDTMKELSSQVADTAVQISNDAERISDAVTSNVDTISQTISVQNEIVQNLNEAVENIISAAKSVENVSFNIENVSDDFEKIANESKELRKQADEIKEIADTVMSIAEQTNLLALNAAIEAARSGEAGRGFAVVADEIRKLAEESKESANKISDFLTKISSGIENLSVGVVSGYENLKAQTKALSESSKKSKESSQVISDITGHLNSLIESLNTEASKLEDITNSIQNLLAISEESSATAEEISASIQRFLTELRTVFDNVSKTISLLELIQENIEKIDI